MSYSCTSISDMDDSVVEFTNSNVVCAIVVSPVKKGTLKWLNLLNIWIKSECINNAFNLEY